MSAEIDEVVKVARLLVDNHAKAPAGHRPSAAVILSRAVLALHEENARHRLVAEAWRDDIQVAQDQAAERIAAWLESTHYIDHPTQREIVRLLRAGAWRKP